MPGARYAAVLSCTLLATPASAQRLDGPIGSMLGVNPNPGSFWNQVYGPQPQQVQPEEPRPAPKLTPEQREQLRREREHASRVVDWLFGVAGAILVALAIAVALSVFA